MISSCPKCGRKFELKPELAGRTVPCPNCHTLILVSAPAEPPQLETQSAAGETWLVRYPSGQSIGPASKPQLLAAIRSGQVVAGCVIRSSREDRRLKWLVNWA